MHSLLIVIGNGNLEEMMKPFWQDLEVEEYCVGVVSNNDKQEMMQFYTKRDKVKYRSFESCYKAHGRDWNYNRYRKDRDGVWREYSRSNPNMKWDWYEVGGRFAGRLVLKEGVKRNQPINFSWGWSENDKSNIINERPYRADVALLGDIDNIDSLTAISVLKDGEWIDLAEGFDGMPVKSYLEGMPGDTLITVVDYHM